MIREELAHLVVPIGDVTIHPRNVRQGDVGAISESLKEHGQYRPIVVQRSTGHVLAGNHTLKAAKALGWDRIAVTYVDCDDDRALRILLADNRTNDLATYDDAALADLLRELADTEAGLAGTMFNGDDLDDLCARIIQPTILNVEDAFSRLPQNDRPDATQMTFTVTLDQAEQIKDCLKASKKRHDFNDTGNENSNGNALWAICDEWQRHVC